MRKRYKKSFEICESGKFKGLWGKPKRDFNLLQRRIFHLDNMGNYGNKKKQALKHNSHCKTKYLQRLSKELYSSVSCKTAKSDKANSGWGYFQYSWRNFGRGGLWGKGGGETNLLLLLGQSQIFLNSNSCLRSKEFCFTFFLAVFPHTELRKTANTENYKKQKTPTDQGCTKRIHHFLGIGP